MKKTYIKRALLIVQLICIGSALTFGQGVGISNTTITPNASSLLELRSTTQGLLVPRLNTAQMNAIASPDTGLIVYNTDSSCMCFYSATAAKWQSMCHSSGISSATSPLFISGSKIALVQKDIDTVGTILSGVWNGGIIQPSFLQDSLLIAGTNVTLSRGAAGITINSSNTGGTVTSFSSGNLNPLFTTSVSNSTTTPALSFSPVSETKNLFYGTGNVTGSPIFRTLYASALGTTLDTTISHTSSAANNIAVYSGANNIAGLSTANNGVLVTSAAGVPSISTTIPLATQTNITELGTINTGTWNGTPIATAYVANNAVTYAKMQQASANTLLGNPTGATGNVQQITLGAGLSFTGTTLISTGGGTYTAGTGLTLTGTTFSLTNPVTMALGGTNAALTANNGGIFYSTATAGAILAGTPTANQVLVSGASGAPKWSTATYPATTTVDQLLYSNATNTITGLTTANDGVLVTSGTGVPSISTTIPVATQTNITEVGTINTGTWNGTPIATGFVANNAVTYAKMQQASSNTLLGNPTGATGNVQQITLGAGLTFSGSTLVATSSTYSAGSGLNLTGTTFSLASPVAMALGGTNAALTANNGGIFYSTATAGAILAGTPTAKQILMSGSTAAPIWSSATYPSTTTTNQLLYSNATNTITGLTTTNDGVLITSATGVPSISSTLPTATQTNITELGTINTGTWNGTPIATGFVANNAVTYAKMQQASANTLLGNPTGATGNDE